MNALADASRLRQRGNEELASGAFAAAVASYRAALVIEPGSVRAHNNLGQALMRLDRRAEAMASYERAIELDPGYAIAYNNLGIALHEQGAYEAALRCYERALELNPSFAEAHNNLGNTLQQLKRYDEAARHFERLFDLVPDHQRALGAAFGARLACCDWTQYADASARIAAGVHAAQPVIQPFTFLAISDSPELQLRCARIHVDNLLPAAARLPWNGARYEHEKIRVAYLSADYHEHATAALTAGLFEAHDRQRFETIAISFGPDDSSAMRRRLEGAFDRFIDIRQMSDTQAVQLLQSLEIDIAVDLKGHTTRRLGLLARRPAPVQVNYLGYPGTMGLEQIDYILADPIVLPREQRCHYSESVAYLPECYQVNDDRRVIAEVTPTRGELGLPPDGFVFCCFNNHYKITPAIFAVWMQLLQQVPGSVLWLLEDNHAAARNLRREAQDGGVSAERLVFASRLGAAEHLARQRLADLFLDTLPYNAHTTASDALWAGLPVLTCLGNAFPGRVAASLLEAIGLSELITHTLEEYAARAMELASDPGQLGALRVRLARNRGNHPLFDTGRFCRHLEAAYTVMWGRHREGLRPESFAVPPLRRA
jgi:protein O-GlcNAc transferase